MILTVGEWRLRAHRDNRCLELQRLSSSGRWRTDTYPWDWPQGLEVLHKRLVMTSPTEAEHALEAARVFRDCAAAIVEALEAAEDGRGGDAASK